MLYEISFNAAEAIPYKSNKERFEIERAERRKNRYVEVVDELKIIYSAKKWRSEDGKFVSRVTR